MTCQDKYGAATLFDHLYVTHRRYIQACGVFPSALSDHHTIYGIHKHRSSYSGHGFGKTITWHIFDLTSFRLDLSKSDLMGSVQDAHSATHA